MTDVPDAPESMPDASSVLLLRDGTGGVEVFVVERKKAGAFAGLLAYPGGKVDPTDRSLPSERWTGIELDALVDRLGMQRGDADDRARVLGWCVAAVREAFEEVGVLLAHHGDGRPVTAEELDSPAFVEARRRLVQRGVPWDWTDWLGEQDLVLDLGAAQPWSRWITPEVEPRRFDTLFFVAAVPPIQAAALAHDEVEVVASRWLTPGAVLAEREAGTSTVIYPTRRQLPGIDGAAAEVVAASADRDLRPVQPTIVTEGDEVVAHHPHDGTVEPVF